MVSVHVAAMPWLHLRPGSARVHPGRTAYAWYIPYKILSSEISLYPKQRARRSPSRMCLNGQKRRPIGMQRRRNRRTELSNRVELHEDPRQTSAIATRQRSSNTNGKLQRRTIQARMVYVQGGRSPNQQTTCYPSPYVTGHRHRSFFRLESNNPAKAIPRTYRRINGRVPQPKPRLLRSLNANSVTSHWSCLSMPSYKDEAIARGYTANIRSLRI